MEARKLPDTWLDEFNVNVDFIDEQHRYFFKLLKNLESAVNTKTCHENISSIFFSLVHYVDHYLIQEELYFKGLNYPTLQDHHVKHDVFVSGIINMKNDFAGGKKKVCENLLSFMNDYFHDHILGYDKKAIDYLKQKGL